MPDQEVKVGLSIEESGEPAAFEDAAKAIQSLTSSAGGAEPSLESLVAALERLGAAAEGPEEAKQAVAAFAGALRELAGATGIDQQRAAVERATEAWRRLGETVPDVLHNSSQAAAEFQSALEKLEETERHLADPLTESLDKANQALEGLSESIDGSMSGAGEKLALVRRRVDEYREAMDAARRSGAEISGPQAAELARLEAEYAKATQKIGEFAAAKREATKDIQVATAAASGEVTQIRSTTDLLSAASPRWGQYAQVVGHVAEAFKVGYEAGNQLRGMLNELTGGEFDRSIQKFFEMEKAADRLVDGFDRAARSAETLANQRRLFEKLGLGGFSQDVEQNAAALEAHARSVAGDKAEIAKLQTEVEKLAGSLGVSKQKLDEQAASLAQTLSAFAAQNQQLGAADLAKIFGPQIQAVLDGYAKLKIQVPPSLSAIAQAWGVTSSSVEQASKRHQAAVDQLVEGITGAAKLSKEGLEELASVTVDAFSKINVGGLHSDELEKARANVQALIDAYTAAGQQIPADLAQIAQQVGAFQSQSDLMAAACDRARLSTEHMASGAIRAGESTLKLSQDVDTGRQSIEEVNPAVNRAQMSLDELKNKYSEAGRAARQGGDDIKQGSTAGAEATKAYSEAGATVDDLGAKSERAGEQIQGASRQLSDAAKGAQELAGVQIDLSKPADQIKKLAESSASLSTSLKAISASLHEVQSGAGSAFGPLLAELDKVIAKAKEAAGAVSQLTGGGAS
jgi:ABC-type transporter Mla subunit MlaD